ncbi:hypothetical protein YYG_03261 [Plasmodium vinckei petteri]|uniref:Fam-a protein n=1 Tax=Plasmodium vinckei petteri TaxID=138298 RepID=W7AT80_PLAVN|nr:hypothetical protein YYG_03261 [Plasmodium vinckei petteri]
MNKFYIQTALFLLSIFAYANNEILATEPAPGEDTKHQLRSRFATSEEIYENNKHLSCSDNKHKRVINIMNEAVKQLEYYATSKDGYEVYRQSPNDSISYYVKKIDDEASILKVHLNIYASSQYDDIINRLWDPNGSKIFNKGHARVAHISKDKTIIAMTSSNTSDSSHTYIEHENPILKNTYTFVNSLNPKEHFANGRYVKVFVNLAGYLIEKKGDDLEITYIESIKGHSSV